MAAVRKAVDPLVSRALDRYIVVRAAARARVGLRPNKPWWQRPDAAATGAQLSLAINLMLVGIGVPVGFSAMASKKEKERAETRVAPTVAQQLSDADHAVLALVNERRKGRGLPALGILPSVMSAEQLSAAAGVDRAGAEDPHELVYGVHADAAPAWEAALMRKCEALHREGMQRYRQAHEGMTHRTAGTKHPDPQVSLAEARRQGLDI